MLRSCHAIEEAVAFIATHDAIPLILGGDHTITWPDATGVSRHTGAGKVSIIHFDAHADTGNITFGSLYGHGQPMRRLIESGAVRGDRFLQLGLRGYWPEPETLDWMADQRMNSFHMSEIVVARPRRCPRSRRSRSRWTAATPCSCRSTSTSVTRPTRQAPALPSRVA